MDDVTAVIMAGGRSERMRATLSAKHKALVGVLGVPLLERNLLTLLAHGVRNIVVSTSAQECDVADYVRDRGAALASCRGATLSCFQEAQPLGTIGVIAQLDDAGPVLVINVDNLTTLDLRDLVASHRTTSAAMTIATHVEPFEIPFGQLGVVNGSVTGYIEKPRWRLSISSGTYVVSRGARTLMSRTRRTDVPQLVSMLLARGDVVHAFAHEAAWIDINDASAVRLAETLVLERVLEFECWPGRPDCERSTVLAAGATEVFVESRAQGEAIYPGCWDIARAEQAQHDPSWQWLATFDDLDVRTGKVVRHNVFLTWAQSRYDRARCPAVRRVRIEDITKLPSPSSALVRIAAMISLHARRGAQPTIHDAPPASHRVCPSLKEPRPADGAFTGWHANE